MDRRSPRSSHRGSWTGFQPTPNREGPEKASLLQDQLRAKFRFMSAAEIIEQLPKLTSEERSAILRRLRELEENDESLFLHETADSMFRESDQEETRDGHCKTG